MRSHGKDDQEHSHRDVGGARHLAQLKAGDHVWFEAREEAPHHLENRSAEPLKFLVLGERKSGDVVVYPDKGVMMVKALGWKQFDYRKRDLAIQDE